MFFLYLNFCNKQFVPILSELLDNKFSLLIAHSALGYYSTSTSRHAQMSFDSIFFSIKSRWWMLQLDYCSHPFIPIYMKILMHILSIFNNTRTDVKNITDNLFLFLNIQFILKKYLLSIITIKITDIIFIALMCEMCCLCSFLKIKNEIK